MRQGTSQTGGMQESVKLADGCAMVCEQTTMHCLEKGGKHAEANHVRLMMDCSEICHSASKFMSVQSPFHSQVCGVGADICDQCAQSCEQFRDDQMLMQCAEICRRCGADMRRMASMTAQMPRQTTGAGSTMR
ncbi:MAG: four-helix bundle copper-binding protein [Anaerolineae bacterium]